ncbi:LytTR family transcriptional regulator DNA-binding domain-containing protein [Flavobacterium sp. UBA6195]|uniref:LytTR family transcriptional regulator DNA-binding domain-containing protein n=1 Tax=Flavobacterium sp. UBA6195 TaxID=1946554 RepID=UPI0039C85A56
MQDALLQHHFFRIHHSYIINVKKIVKITKKDGLYCELSHGVLIPVAKRRQEAFLKYLK